MEKNTEQRQHCGSDKEFLRLEALQILPGMGKKNYELGRKLMR